MITTRGSIISVTKILFSRSLKLPEYREMKMTKKGTKIKFFFQDTVIYFIIKTFYSYITLGDSGLFFLSIQSNFA